MPRITPFTNTGPAALAHLRDVFEAKGLGAFCEWVWEEQWQVTPNVNHWSRRSGPPNRRHEAS